MKKLLLLVSFFALYNCLSAQQTNNSAFETISVGLSFNKVLSISNTGSYWDEDNGVEADIFTPFYTGNIGVGLLFRRFKRIEHLGNTDFSSLYIYLAWKNTLISYKNFNLSVIARLGMERFTFDEDNNLISKGDPLQSEMEIRYGTGLEASFNITKSWGLSTTLIFDRTETYHAINTLMINAGVVYIFDSPAWFKGALL